MKARLSSLLVAGAAVLAAMPSMPLGATSSEREIQPSPSLKGIVREGDGSDRVNIHVAIPGFQGQPRLEVLARPDRVVVDLPGVLRGDAVNRKDIQALVGGMVSRVRIAQFTTAPNLITRMVLEVAPGTQVAVQPTAEGLSLDLRPGTGKVLASLAPTSRIPAPVSAEPVVPAPALARKESAAPVPALGLPFQPLPSVAAAALLPAAPQEQPKAAEASRTADRSGRTLGDAATRYTGSRMTIDVKGAEVRDILKLIAEHAKLNLVADPEVSGAQDILFYDTPWDQILDILLKHAGLGKEISNGVIRVAKVEKLQKEEEDRKKLEEAKALAGDLQTVTRPLSFAKASESKAIIEKLLSPRGSIIVDDRTNTLILKDLPGYLTLVDDLIATMDIQIQQVQIEARVVEATKNMMDEWGVQWPSANTVGNAKLSTLKSDGSGGTEDAIWSRYGNGQSWNSAGGFNRPASGQAAGTAWTATGATGLTNPAGEFWVSFLSNRISINVILQALEKDGKVKIVSSPKVVTQNNKPAKILSGEKIPYPTQQGGAQGGAITVAFVDANLQLDVTPQITNDGTILMDIKVEKAEADFSTTVLGTPRILRKALETQVLVKDGGTAVLGGVYTNFSTKETTGIPYLSKIPVLGWLFKSRKDNEKTAELLVFITPRILKS